MCPRFFESPGEGCERRSRLESAITRADAERAEVELLLSSRKLARANHLGRFLAFVCEKYFEGAASEIKEYSIAVEALGRPPEFDPQVDCIVRVTAHNLRKQLELYYATEGASHAVHVFLPPGHYVPQFVHREDQVSQAGTSEVRGSNGEHSLTTQGHEKASRAGDNGRPPRELNPAVTSNGIKADPGSQAPLLLGPKRLSRAAIAGLTLALCGGLLTVTYLLWTRSSTTKTSLPNSALAASLNVSGAGIYALMGDDRSAFVDQGGLSWLSDRFCSGGEPFHVTGHEIKGTGDQQLFFAGRRGVFHCQYSVPPGIYEVHLLLAETSGLQEASRSVTFSIDGGPSRSVDVVDEAGGDDIATEKIITDVQPQSDGAIHVDFTTAESFANAIEILPGIADHGLPVRIAVRQSAYRDAQGSLWLPDRYFFGGRVSRFGGDLSKLPGAGLYEGHRFGHFHYVIPVAPGATYTLKLHFLEQWFGAPNRGIGGVGSRVFDVSCNGSTLLKNFDIYREAGSEPIVKTFSHIGPTAQGKIELYFTPVVNYPSISAIEVLQE